MVEDPQQSDATEKKTSGSSVKLLVVIVVVAVVAVLVVMGGGIFMLWSKMAAVRGKSVAAKPVAVPKATLQQTFRPVYALEAFIVPLASPESKRFFRVTLALELSHDSDRLALRQNLSRVRETIHGILPNRTVAQIVTTQGKAALRDEILNGLRTVLPEQSVTDLYYVELVVE